MINVTRSLTRGVRRALLASGGAFRPIDIANLQLWLKADAGVFQESTFVTPSGDGDVVGGWRDLSGNGNDVIQATTANKPLLRLAHVNGLPAIEWDATDDRLTNASFVDFGDVYTAFVVARMDNTAADDRAFFDVSTGATNSGFLFFHSGTTIFRAVDNVGQQDVTGADRRDDTYYLHTLHSTGSQSQHWVDNASAGTTPYTAPNNNVTDQIDIGNLAGVAFSLDGLIAELAIFNVQLSAANRGLMNTYMANRYGLTLS